MEDERLLNAIIDDIYSASLTTDDPTPLLGRIAELLGYETAGLVTARSRYAHATCNASYGVDLKLCKRAEEEFGVTVKSTMLRGQEIQTGQFGFREEFISDADLRLQPYYHEFLLPQRMAEGLKFCHENSRDRLIFANFARPLPGADRARQRVIAETLAPHWVRAARIFLKLGQLDLLRRAYEDSANMAPFPIVVYDNTATLHFANARAQQLAGTDGLALSRKGLQAALDAENHRLRHLIRQVVASSNTAQGQLAGAEMSITRPSGKRPYQLVIIPLSPGRLRDGHRPAAVVIIFDPDAELMVTLKRCNDVFGFTRAEAQVALGVMQGKSMEQIAACLGNSVATSRNLLKRVFQKAGVNRQNELTRLMLSSPLFLDPHEPRTAPAESPVIQAPARVH